MGYWNADPENATLSPVPAETVWGDLPADVFDEAIRQIVVAFQHDVGRKPTKAELRAGLEFSLGVYKDPAPETGK